ncbi:hypothetical protein ACOME3_000590 [Neoechinorhynchus agilis]
MALTIARSDTHRIDKFGRLNDYLIELVYNSLDAVPSRISIRFEMNKISVDDDGHGINVSDFMKLGKESLKTMTQNQFQPLYGKNGKSLVRIAMACDRMFISIAKQRCRLEISRGHPNRFGPIIYPHSTIGCLVEIFGLLRMNVDETGSAVRSDEIYELLSRLKPISVLHPFVQFEIRWIEGSEMKKYILHRTGHPLHSLANAYTIDRECFSRCEAVLNSTFFGYFLPISPSSGAKTLKNAALPFVAANNYPVDPKSTIAKIFYQVAKKTKALIFLSITLPRTDVVVSGSYGPYYRIDVARFDDLMTKFKILAGIDSVPTEPHESLCDIYPKSKFLVSEEVGKPCGGTRNVSCPEIKSDNPSTNQSSNKQLLKRWKTRVFKLNEHQKEIDEIFKNDEQLPKGAMCTVDMDYAIKKFAGTNTNVTDFMKARFSKLIPVGQVDRKFIACVSVESATERLLILIDQHACHERIRMEDLTRGLEEAEHLNLIPTADLYPAILFQNNCTMFNSESLSVFSRLGFKFEVDSNTVNSYTLVKIPMTVHKMTSKITRKQFVVNLVNAIAGSGYSCRNIKLSELAIIQNEIKNSACRGAIKFGDEINVKTCQTMIDQLSKCKQPCICAHGRPSFKIIGILKK